MRTMSINEFISECVFRKNVLRVSLIDNLLEKYRQRLSTIYSNDLPYIKYTEKRVLMGTEYTKDFNLPRNICINKLLDTVQYLTSVRNKMTEVLTINEITYLLKSNGYYVFKDFTRDFRVYGSTGFTMQEIFPPRESFKSSDEDTLEYELVLNKEYPMDYITDEWLPLIIGYPEKSFYVNEITPESDNMEFDWKYGPLFIRTKQNNYEVLNGKDYITINSFSHLETYWERNKMGISRIPY